MNAISAGQAVTSVAMDQGILHPTSTTEFLLQSTKRDKACKIINFSGIANDSQLTAAIAKSPRGCVDVAVALNVLHELNYCRMFQYSSPANER